MNNFRSLFIDIAQSGEVLAEQVYDYDLTQHDEQGAKTAELMRKDFATLRDNISNETYVISHNDYAKLLLGAMLATNHIQDRIKRDQEALKGYNLTVIPRLQRIINETHTDEEANLLAQELLKD